MSERLFEEFPEVSREAWLSQVEKDLKGTPLTRLQWENESGIPLNAIYRKEDLPEGLDQSFPADGNNRRGGHPWMYADKPWEICIELSVADPDSALNALKSLEHAPDAVRFVLPFEQRHAFVAKTVASSGPDTVETWRKLLNAAFEIGSSVHLDAGQASFGHFAAWVQALRQSGMQLGEIRGSGGTSVLSMTAGRPFSLGVMKDLLEDGHAAFAFVRSQMPNFRAVVVDMQPFALSGANQAQELAWAIGMAVEYADQWAKNKDEVADLFRSLAFRFPVSNDFFAEISRLRAFRMLWARVLQAYGLDASDPSFTCILTTGSRRHLSALDIPTNILRGTTQAMSAILGGADSVSIPAYDELSGQINDLSLRLSSNLQRVIRHESAFAFAVDPSAGSYYVEHLTNAFADRSWGIFQEMEAQGGFLQQVQSGAIAQILAGQLAKRKSDINRGKTFVLGVNQYPDKGNVVSVDKGKSGEDSIQIPGVVREALSAGVGSRLDLLAQVLQDCRISTVAALRREKIGGDWVAWDENRDSASYEELRQRAGGMAIRPACLLTFGDLTMRQARGSFAMNLLAGGGIPFETAEHPDDIQAALSSCILKKPQVVVLCSSDANYAESAPLILSTLRSELPETKLILAGKPQGWELWKDNGLDGCIYMGMDRWDWLNDLLNFLEPIQNMQHAS